MALNSLICADVPLRNCSLTHLWLQRQILAIRGRRMLPGFTSSISRGQQDAVI